MKKALPDMKTTFTAALLFRGFHAQNRHRGGSVKDALTGRI
jgi:hypothetical protein